MRNGSIYGIKVIGRRGLIILGLIVTYCSSQALNNSKELHKLSPNRGILGLNAVYGLPPMSRSVYTQETTNGWQECYS